ncbi:hypothetical protein ACFWYA_00320 [Streptomyces sp. NPDC059011]|uniref:hypothetical protein n=1 Tax=unclassified Streptomyces TaxID=2593676 RepID=UPI0036A82E47
MAVAACTGHRKNAEFISAPRPSPSGEGLGAPGRSTDEVSYDIEGFQGSDNINKFPAMS